MVACGLLCCAEPQTRWSFQQTAISQLFASSCGHRSRRSLALRQPSINRLKMTMRCWPMLIQSAELSGSSRSSSLIRKPRAYFKVVTSQAEMHRRRSVGTIAHRVVLTVAHRQEGEDLVGTTTLDAAPVRDHRTTSDGDGGDRALAPLTAGEGDGRRKLNWRHSGKLSSSGGRWRWNERNVAFHQRGMSA